MKEVNHHDCAYQNERKTSSFLLNFTNRTLVNVRGDEAAFPARETRPLFFIKDIACVSYLLPYHHDYTTSSTSDMNMIS